MNLSVLKPAQRAVFDLLVQGKSTREIGGLIHRAEGTVKSHITAIFKRFECKSRAELIARHYRNVP